MSEHKENDTKSITYSHYLTKFYPDYSRCLCPECLKSTFEWKGEILTGVLIHRKGLKKHMQHIEKLAQSSIRIEDSGDSDLRASRLDLIVNTNGQKESSIAATHTSKRKREDVGFESEEKSFPVRKSARLADRQLFQIPEASRFITTLNTSKFKMPRVFLHNKECLQIMFHVLNDLLLGHKTHKFCRASLDFERNKMMKQKLSVDPNSKPIWKAIPKSIPILISRFFLTQPIEEVLCCQVCFALHGSLSNVTEITKLKCDNIRFMSSNVRSEEPRKSCDAPLLKEIKPRHSTVDTMAIQKKPRMIFYHQNLGDWLGKMFFYSYFEKAIDVSIHRTPPADGCLYDIWDGEMWNDFKHDGKRYTETSGHLVFGFYCDWFNPRGKSAAKRSSTGLMLLICLNLPPELRYKKEYMFLYGIIPGPEEPSTDDINHVLNPLITEFETFWKGVRFTSTSLYPRGRLIRAVIWPLIADIPASKKISGFSGHQSTCFCSRCYIKRMKKQVGSVPNHNRIELEHFRHRDDDEHKNEAMKWLAADTLKAQTDLLKETGVRYSAFSRLPYWRPVSFVTIDIMHCVFLGVLKELTTTYLNISSAGVEVQKNIEKLASKQVYDHLVSPIIDKSKSRSTTSSKPGSKQASLNEDVEMEDQQLEGSDHPTKSSDKKTSSSHSTRTYYARKAKDHHQSREEKDLSSSESSGGTVQPVEAAATNPTLAPPPVLTAHELGLVHHSIRNSIKPSWFTKLHEQFGCPGTGTAKAADWMVLYSVHMVFSIIPLLHQSEPNSQSRLLYKSVLLAAQISNISTSRRFDPKDKAKFTNLITEFRQTLHEGWPLILTKPNLHYLQHIPDLCTQFGPPSSTAAFAGERVVGYLVQTPKNGVNDNTYKTLLQSYTQSGFLRMLIDHQSDVLDQDLEIDELVRRSSTKWSLFKSEDLQFFPQPINCEPLEKTNNFRIGNKSFSTSLNHHANSHIQYSINSVTYFGTIQQIFRCVNQADNAPIFLVSTFRSLNPTDSRNNPYLDLAFLNAEVLYQDKLQPTLVKWNQIVGHCCALYHSIGKFNIPEPIVSCIGLRNLGFLDT